MALIRGIDVLLHVGGGTETVHNVLVGQPTTEREKTLASAETGRQAAFTLAIPKGDTHDWTNKVVEFFGQTYRTVGAPLRGIEANIPLDWHTQISVERLDVTGAVTVYAKDTFERRVYTQAYYSDERGQVVQTDGVYGAGKLTVRLYADISGSDIAANIGDIVVLGACDFVFDTTTQAAASASMASFRAAYSGEYAVISEVSRVSTGGDNPDFLITAV